MLGLPAGSWTKFERDRAIADIGLIELVRSQGHLLLEDALKYLDLRVEALGELVLGAAIEESWPVEITRAKVEGGLDFVVSELLRHHRLSLVVGGGLQSDPDALRAELTHRVQISARWCRILSRVANLPAQPAQDTTQQDKGNFELLRGHEAVIYKTAQRYLGIKERAVQLAVAKRKLRTVGKGLNKRITVESLLAYLSPTSLEGSHPGLQAAGPPHTGKKTTS